MCVITTERFRITSQQYFRAEASHLARKLFLIGTSILLVFIIATLFNTIFVFIGIILFFLVIPPLIAFIYLTKLLTIEAQRSLNEKYIVIEPGAKIDVKFEEEKIIDYSIPWNVITSVKIGKEIIEIRDKDDKILLLIPKMFITSCECFDDFSTDMNWEDKKNN